MGFSAGWLSLREPADHAARDDTLLRMAAERAVTAGGESPVIVDLGCGTGSTVRALAPLLPGARWRLVDNDPALLDCARESAPGAELHQLDIAHIDALPLDGAHLVTASALLDLVPDDWLRDLAARLAVRGIGFYAALTYDGAMSWTPPMAEDAAITTAFNDHQRGVKSLGPALGPDGGAVARDRLEAEGFTVRTGDSPWQLGPDDAALQGALFAGIAEAARAAGAADAEAWLDRRLAARDAGGCRIGHLDVLAIPPQD